MPGVSLSTSSVSLALNTTPATVGGVPAGPYFRVSATGLDLVVAGQQVHAGTLTVERSTVGGTPVTRLEITGGGLVLTAGGTDFVTLDQVAGTLVLSAAGVSGRLSARVTLGGGLGSVLTVGTVRVALNTGAATVGDLPAGPYVRVEALGAALTLGGQTLTGDLAFERSTTQAGATVVRVVASHVGLTLTAGTTPVATLTDGSGLILLTSTGMALQLGGTIAVTVPGVTVTGALVVQANSTGAAVNEVLSLDGADVLLAMPSNGTSSYLRFVGTGMVLDVAGQRLAGDLTIERNGLVTTVGLTGASLSLGGGLLTVTGASASLTVEPTGLHGSFSGAVAFAAPGISLGANLTVDLDTRPATRHVTVSGPDVSVTVAGQSLRAAVSFESTTTAAGQRVVRAAIANVGPNPLLTLGTPGSQVSVTTASGQLLLTGTGVALGLTATVAVTLPGITLTPGTVRVEVNTLTAPVAETFTVAGSPVTLSLPAGPYLRVSLTGASLALTTVPGTPTLSGSFAFEQRGQRTIIAATDVEVAVSIGTTAARLTQGQGVFVLVGASGIAGYLSGKASVAAGGVQAGGDILLRVDTALNTAIDETVEVGGQTLNVKFPSSATAVYAVSLTGARLTIGDFVTIEGDVAFTNDTFAGDGLTLFVGRGPARLDTGELNPLATGVLMTNARIGLVRVGAGYALVASGTVSLVGVTGVTLTGTVTARVNTTGAALTRTLTIDGSAGPGIELAFTGPEVVKEFQAVGATLTVAGQSLTGTFAFSQVAGGDVTVAATGVAANLGGGAVTLSSGTAALLVSANGIAGRITGTLNVSVPGLTLGSGFTVVLNSSAAPVSRTFDVAGTTVALDVPAGPFVRVEATHMTIGLLGQSLTADLVIQRATGADGTAVTTVGLANVDLVLGSGGTGVRLTGGSGLLVAGTGGIAGRLSGTVAVTLPAGTSLTGDLTVAVNTGFGAVSTSLTVGSTTLTLALPAGPYLRFEGTGLVLTVLGQTLSGDVAFEKATDLGADGAIGGTGLNADTSVVRLAMTHVAIDLGGVLKVREGTALLLLTPAGLAGTVSGTVTLAVPQVSLTGTLAVQVNTTGAAVSTSFLVAGAAGPVSLALPKGPYLRLAGTGVVLTVLGQSLAADVVLTRTVDAAGASTVTVEVRNLDLRLGGTAASPVVSVSQATGGVGTLVLGPTGVVGSIAVDVAVALPNVTLTGGFAVQVNTTSVAALGVPAGPFVRVSGTGVHLNVLDQVLTGSFTVEQVTTTAGAKVVRVGISGASLVLLSGKVSVTDVSGLVVLSPAGVAASLAASLSVSLTGVAVSGTVTLDVNTTAAAVSSSLVVGGTTVALALPAGPYLKVTGTGVTLTVAGQALRGDISVEKATSLGADKLLGTADDSAQLRIAAANVSAAFGDGTRDLLTLSNGSAVLLVTANGMAGQVSGTVALVGVPGVSLAGTLGVRIHDAGTGAVDETFVVGGVTTQLKFAAADPSLVVTGTGVTLTVAGQSLAGDVTVTKGTGSLTVAIANGALTLGTPSAPIVRATGINGSFTTSSAGFWGTLTGSLEVSVPDVSLSSSVDVSIDTRTTGDGVKLVATGTTLTVGGQTISATTLTFRRSGAGVVDVTVAGFTVTLGGLATLTGNGALRITPQGLAAALQVTSATFTLGSSVSMGLETGGSVVVQVNTSATPVTLTVGTDTVVVPGGPFFQVAVTGGFLQVTSGPRFTGSFVLAKGTKPGFGDTGHGVPRHHRGHRGGDRRRRRRRQDRPAGRLRHRRRALPRHRRQHLQRHLRRHVLRHRQHGRRRAGRPRRRRSARRRRRQGGHLVDVPPDRPRPAHLLRRDRPDHPVGHLAGGGRRRRRRLRRPGRGRQRVDHQDLPQRRPRALHADDAGDRDRHLPRGRRPHGLQRHPDPGGRHRDHHADRPDRGVERDRRHVHRHARLLGGRPLRRRDGRGSVARDEHAPRPRSSPAA